MSIVRMAVVTLLAGCITACVVAPVEPPRSPATVTTETPVCTSPRQCEAMWLSARQAAEMISGMRIRIYTENFMETFAPPRGRIQPGVSVTKEPRPDGGYDIRARVRCRNSCADLEASGENLFNTLVTSAGIRVK